MSEKELQSFYCSKCMKTALRHIGSTGACASCGDSCKLLYPDFIFECSFCRHRVYIGKFDHEGVVALAAQSCPHCDIRVDTHWKLIGHGDRKNVEQSKQF